MLIRTFFIKNYTQSRRSLLTSKTINNLDVQIFIFFSWFLNVSLLNTENLQIMGLCVINHNDVISQKKISEFLCITTNCIVCICISMEYVLRWMFYFIYTKLLDIFCLLILFIYCPPILYFVNKNENNLN